MINKKVGFIGAGNMATAIINGLLLSKSTTAENIFIYDLDGNKMQIMSDKGINTTSSASEAVEKSDIIVLAVKPQNYEEILNSIKSAVNDSKVFVSIAAGISTDYVKSMLGVNCPMVRVMPNTPLLLGKGATAMSRSNISDEDFSNVYQMFATSGIVEELSENQMNSIIAVNGSSPAYIYLFAKAMVDYAKEVGIDSEKALRLVAKTLEGSADMLINSGDTPDMLIKKVSSPGGTTIAALNTMNEMKFYDAVIEGMRSCTARAEELGK